MTNNFKLSKVIANVIKYVTHFLKKLKKVVFIIV